MSIKSFVTRSVVRSRIATRNTTRLAEDYADPTANLTLGKRLKGFAASTVINAATGSLGTVGHGIQRSLRGEKGALKEEVVGAFKSQVFGSLGNLGGALQAQAESTRIKRGGKASNTKIDKIKMGRGEIVDNMKYLADKLTAIQADVNNAHVFLVKEMTNKFADVGKEFKNLTKIVDVYAIRAAETEKKVKTLRTYTTEKIKLLQRDVEMLKLKQKDSMSERDNDDDDIDDNTAESNGGRQRRGGKRSQTPRASSGAGLGTTLMSAASSGAKALGLAALGATVGALVTNAKRPARPYRHPDYQQSDDGWQTPNSARKSLGRRFGILDPDQGPNIGRFSPPLMPWSGGGGGNAAPRAAPSGQAPSSSPRANMYSPIPQPTFPGEPSRPYVAQQQRDGGRDSSSSMPYAKPSIATTSPASGGGRTQTPSNPSISVDPNFDPGNQSKPGTWNQRSDVPFNGIPASVRYNNPGASWSSSADDKYGVEGYGIIGGANRIGKFPTVSHGMASNMDLFARSKNYMGRTLEQATYTWRGNRPGNVPTGTLSDGTKFGPNTVITPELAKNPEFMKFVFSQYTKHEAGRKTGITQEQIDTAFKMYQAGGIDNYKKLQEEARTKGGSSSAASGNKSEIPPGVTGAGSEIIGGEGKRQSFQFTTEKQYTKNQIDDFIKVNGKAENTIIGVNPSYEGADQSYANIKTAGAKAHVYHQGPGMKEFGESSNNWENKLRDTLKKYPSYSHEVDNLDQLGSPKAQADWIAKHQTWMKENGINSQFQPKNATAAHLEAIKNHPGIDQNLIGKFPIMESSLGKKDIEAARKKAAEYGMTQVDTTNTNNYKTANPVFDQFGGDQQPYQLGRRSNPDQPGRPQLMQRPADLPVPAGTGRAFGAMPMPAAATPTPNGVQKEQGSPSGVIEQSQGSVAAIRKRPITDKLEKALQYASAQSGVGAEVVSGGQAPIGSGGPRTGSTRHDHGNAADLKLFRTDESGKKTYLDFSNPKDRPYFEAFAKNAAAAGATGIGAGSGYMGNQLMHVGYGPVATWGGAPWVAKAFAEGRDIFKNNPPDLNAPIAVNNAPAQGKVVVPQGEIKSEKDRLIEEYERSTGNTYRSIPPGPLGNGLLEPKEFKEWMKNKTAQGMTTGTQATGQVPGLFGINKPTADQPAITRADTRTDGPGAANVPAAADPNSVTRADTQVDGPGAPAPMAAEPVRVDNPSAMINPATLEPKQSIVPDQSAAPSPASTFMKGGSNEAPKLPESTPREDTSKKSEGDPNSYNVGDPSHNPEDASPSPGSDGYGDRGGSGCPDGPAFCNV
jgi:hypothetical protein